MTIEVEVVARSSTESVEAIKREGRTVYRVHVRAVPEKGKANTALIKILAQFFNVAPSQIIIRRGERGRRKVIAID